MKKTKIWHMTIAVFLLLTAGYLLTACFPLQKTAFTKEPLAPENVKVISELAYDVNPELGYTVYIEEAGKPEPYLVLTADYNDKGDTLLLRKFLFEKLRRYNPPTYSSYYNGCEIDLWLNGFFLEMIGAEPLESRINISAEEALDCVGGQTEDILRKAFLLSSGEVGQEDSYVIPASGKTLAYFGEMKTFDDLMKRVAYRGNMNGEKESWYLRSVSTWYYNMAVGVSPDGVVGGIPVDREFGVRPAFCLDSNTPVLIREDGEEPFFFIEKPIPNPQS